MASKLFADTFFLGSFSGVDLVRTLSLPGPLLPVRPHMYSSALASHADNKQPVSVPTCF
jgi:hypothetical protein